MIKFEDKNAAPQPTDPKTHAKRTKAWVDYLRNVGHGKVKPGVQNQPK